MVESISNKPSIIDRVHNGFNAARIAVGNIEFFNKRSDLDKGLTVERTAPRANSQIQNDYYTGAPYNIQINGDIIKGKNLDTGREFEIDTMMLLGLNEVSKARELQAIVQELPGEVLEDLSLEADRLMHKDNPSSFLNLNANNSANGTYNVIRDRITTESNPETIVHELGHALDNKVHDDGLRKLTSSNNPQFLEAFRKELEAAKPAIKEDFRCGIEYDMYCLTDEREMFAECYTLLMLGDCQSKDTIVKYFPETLEQAKAQIDHIRSMDDNARYQSYGAGADLQPPKIQGLDEIAAEIAETTEPKTLKSFAPNFV